jgi:hypothetical protein
MQELQLNLRQLLHIWWLRTWRGFLVGMLVVTPFALGFYWVARTGMQSPWLRVAQSVIVTLIGAGVAYIVSRMALVKRYPGFRIALMPHDSDGPELPLLSRHVIAFWWFLVWRMTLGAGLVTLASRRAAPHLSPGGNIARQIVTIVIILAWEFIVLRMALIRRYRDFRIALIGEAKELP